MTLRFLSLIWFCLPLVVMAQEEAKQSPAVETENSLLWEIRGKGLQKPSYLYGTIHMISKEDFFLTEATNEVFSKSEKVVFEVNTEEMFDLSTQFSLLMKSFMDGGKRLRDLVNKEDYQLVENHFNKIGMPLMLLERVKPMILSVFAAEDFGKGGINSGAIKSYEIELTEMARNQNKPIAGLETLDYQMSMFDSIPYDAQAKMLVESIKTSTTDSDGEFEKMVELYKNQDLKGMEDMILSESGGIGGYDKILLVNRNRNWIPLMAEMMTEKSTFFAVGAGHLGGKEGVISLLRDAGFEVRPLR